jgi:hypothetical protein
MAQYVHSDDAPFGVPPSTKLHYAVTVTTTAESLVEVTDLVTTDPHVVPSYLAGNDEKDRKWPKAVYVGHMTTAHDVWVTWDGEDPVVGAVAPIGIKVPPTYPSLRIPAPAAIRAGTIKFISDQAGGTPVILTYEF